MVIASGNGSKPGDVLNDSAAPARAKTFFTQEPPLARYPFEAGAGAEAA